jgi:multimeric flavodoxin WrbA
MIAPRKLLVLIGSPRRAGNSATLAKAVQRGAEATGAEVSLRFVDDYISSFLRDCRLCRLPSGECSIADQFRTLFFENFIPAQGVIFCSPVYWYGLSAQMKAFFDRTFCYYAASYPDSARVIDGMSRNASAWCSLPKRLIQVCRLASSTRFRSFLVTRIPSLLAWYVALPTAAARSLVIRVAPALPQNSSGAIYLSASIPTTGSIPNGVGGFGRLNRERSVGNT